jgi:hypothetical protein
MSAPFRISTFRVDVTPPIGHSTGCSVNLKVDSPLYVRGLIIDDGAARAVLAVVDFLGLGGRAYAEWQRRIARAAGTTPARVLLHSVHQHDAVWVRLEADDILSRAGFKPAIALAYWRDISARLERAVRAAAAPRRWQKVRALATAERRLSELAANRRLVGPDGKVWGMRFSMCRERKFKREPVGKIDPILRTVGFLGDRGQVLATMHFYATHPQVAYSRNMAGSDVPGVALGRLEKALGGRGMHLYFTGCGADVTYGKYTFPDKEKSLRVIGARLGAGLVANVRNLEAVPGGPLVFARARFDPPVDRRCTERKVERQIRRSKNADEAHWPATVLAFLRERRQKRAQPEIVRMSLGPAVHLLSLPSEVVVEYQLYAQALVPDQFLACAAYGDYRYFYLPTAAMYAEGGYEPKVGPYTPAIEAALKGAIAGTLGGVRR